MHVTVRGLVVGALLMMPIACGGVVETPGRLPTTVAPQTESRTPVAGSPTQATATASPTETATPFPTPTWDATRTAGMTLEAIRVAVTASGVPEGSTEFEAQVAATSCALIPPPTATPMPWRLAPEEPYSVSMNCLGSDLPGQDVRLWQDDRWIEASSYSFANVADLEIAQQRYLAYLDVISFRDSPPSDDFTTQLSEHMNSTEVAAAPESCLADEIIGQIMRLAESGYYVRLTFTRAIEWAERAHLFLSVGDIRLALPWSTAAVQQELVEIATGNTIKQATLARFAGTVWFTYSNSSHQWFVSDDDSGYYCAELPLFLD